MYCVIVYDEAMSQTNFTDRLVVLVTAEQKRDLAKRAAAKKTNVGEFVRGVLFSEQPGGGELALLRKQLDDLKARVDRLEGSTDAGKV